MTKIKQLPTMRDEYAEGIVAQLETALARAKAAPQEGMIIHMLGRDGLFDTHYTSLNSHQLLGMLTWAAHNLMAGPGDE